MKQSNVALKQRNVVTCTFTCVCNDDCILIVYWVEVETVLAAYLFFLYDRIFSVLKFCNQLTSSCKANLS